MPLSTIKQAIADFRRGQFVIIVDDPNRENEGDLCLAAEKVTPEAINFMAREARGLICAPMASSWVDRLGLPMMVGEDRNTSRFGTAFTVPVEAAEGTTTGISAYDRATTIAKLADPTATLADFSMPGHVFPLRARAGGVLERRGQTEASVDLARLAGLRPVSVICEIMGEDGRMARLPQLEQFAERHGVHIISVEDLVAYRKAQETAAHQVAETVLPTEHGTFQVFAYENEASDDVDLALVLGDISSDEPLLARLHSECLTGDVFGSMRCDCGEQLNRAIELLEEAGRGVLLYLRQEGRGIGLLNKLRAYHLQDQGFDTVEANLHLGFPADSRDYRVAASILRDLGVSQVRLMTNNPAKVDALARHGIDVTERVPIVVEANESNRQYLETKGRKLGHLFDLTTTNRALTTNDERGGEDSCGRSRACSPAGAGASGS